MPPAGEVAVMLCRIFGGIECVTNTIYFVENLLRGSSHSKVQNHNLTLSGADKCISICDK